MNSILANFHSIGEPTVDNRDKILHGHAPVGVAILWNTNIEHIIKEIRLNVNWAIGIENNINSKKIVIINVYTPYESYDNENEYINRMAHISAFVEELDTTCVYMMGNYNADITDVHSLFAKHLLNSCHDHGFIVSSQQLLPADSFTFMSNWETVSWLLSLYIPKYMLFI